MDNKGTQYWVADYDGEGQERVANNIIMHKGWRRPCCYQWGSYGTIYLEERSDGSPHQINVSVRASVHPSVFSSVHLEYKNTLIFHVGIKIWVSTWSFLSVVPPLRILIPTYHLVFYSKFVSNTKNYFPPQQ